MKKKSFADFVYEMGALRQIRRTPFLNIFDNTDSVADHTFRTMLIAYYLAGEEGLDIEKVLTYALFHDTTEVRCGDNFNIQKKYIKREEKSAVEDIAEGLGEFGERLKAILEKYEDRQEPETKLVKDADIIELYTTLLENSYNGSKYSAKYIEKVAPFDEMLHFKSSVALLKNLFETDPDNFVDQIKAQRV
ncbi:MAG: HD domain-containing protein [Candidatus Dojkabacteria bacterium]|nr:MAG: HD domain-containing protein [Candidatus Dojkabacteria bacterium]